MNTKHQALQQIITLMKAEQITLDDLSKALSQVSTADEKSGIMRVLAYLGGLFIITGISVYITTHWSDLNSFSRVLVTAGIGFGIFLLGIIACYNERLKGAIVPLFIIAALLETSGLFVYLYEYFQHSNNWQPACLFVFGILLVQYSLTFWGLKQPVLMFFVLAFSANFLFALLSWLNMSDSLASITVGLFILGLTRYLDKTPYNGANPFWYLIGSLIFLGSLFCWLQYKPYEFMYVLIACLMVYISIWVKSRMLLLISTLSIFFYIGYFTEKYFVNSIGWPLALIGLGLVLIALSAAAFRLNKYYISEKH